MAMESEDKSGFQREYVSLKVNGIESGLSPMSFALTEFDSIDQFYPKVKFAISDYEGVINEFMGFVDGTTVEIKYPNDSGLR